VGKILSPAGESLADLYQIEGSTIGVVDLDATKIHLLHEMGATILSERIGGAVRRFTTGAIAQNTDFGSTITNLPAGISRIMGASLLADTAARVSYASLLIRNPGEAREMPLHVWDSANDVETTIRIEDNAAGPGILFQLTPSVVPNSPSMLINRSPPALSMQDFALRGRTLGFGAGTVTVIALIYIAFGNTTALSARGMTIPSW